MKLKYSLDKEDFLIFQLNFASKSSSVRKRRRLMWLLAPILYLFITIVSFISNESIFYSLSFLVVGILWLIFFPALQKKRYKKAYEKYVKENLHNRFNKMIHLSFDEKFIYIKDESGESSIKLKCWEELNEIQNYYYLKFNSGVTFIIPKNKLSNLNKFQDFLGKLVQKFKIKHTIDLAWKWE